jgi:NitT/TauT family transport system permease protein
MNHQDYGWRGPVILVAGLLVGWQVLYWIIGEIALRSPLETFRFTAQLVTEPRFWVNLKASLLAFSAALVIGVVAGLTIGFVLGFNRKAGEVFEPILVAIYSLPKVTLYPILLLAFGLGISAKIAFGAIHGFIPIALFTLTSVRNVRPVLIKTGRVLRLDTPTMVRRILFPAALPEIFSGLRIGFSLTLIGTILAEMFASQQGLGYMLMNAIGLHNIDVIMAVTLLLTIFATAVGSVLLMIDRWLHRHG